jgi:hypothetical protein
MYSVDELDTVTDLPDLPRSSVGAPIPLVLADAHRVVVAFCMDDAPGIWDRGPDDPEFEALTGRVALIRFTQSYAHMLGPPNDEAFDGHPLASRGLRPYRSFEVQNSSWIRQLERMNSVHPSHRAEAFANLRHTILAFHDSTFECVAHAYDASIVRGPISSAVPQMVSLVYHDRD